VRGGERVRIYRQLIARAGVEITPAETWLLARLRDRAPIGVAPLAADLGVPEERVALLIDQLQGRGLVTDDARLLELTDTGRAAIGRLVEAGRIELTTLLEHWHHPDDQELGPVVRRLAASLVAEIPDEAVGAR
jgi:DNA-binding MarR family transcriptional regulator